MPNQIIDIVETGIPGATGDVTPAALQAVEDAQAAVVLAANEADRAEDARNQAEVFAAGTVELQDEAVAQVIVAGGAASTAVDTRVAAQMDGAFAPIVGGKVPSSYLPLYVARVSDLETPWVIAHKSAASLVPEQLLESCRIAANLHPDLIIDLDVNLLLDGGLGIMHDGDVSSTTTATGSVNNFSSASFQNLTVDAGSWFGGGWGDSNPVLLTTILAEFGNRRVLSLEAKTQGRCAVELARVVASYGVRESVILGTSYWGDVPTLVATGAHVSYIMQTGIEKTPAEVKAAGISSVQISYAAAAFTPAWVSAMQAEGVQVGVFTVNRQLQFSEAVGKGVDYLFSDDPIYAAGERFDFTYRRSDDPFVSQTFYHGHQPDQGNSIVYGVTKRGVFTSPNKWGIHETTNAGSVGALAGWACPVASPAAWTIDFSIDFNSWVDTGRWAGLYICAEDDRFLIGAGTTKAGDNYYRVLLTPAGSLQVTKFTDGVAQPGGATVATAALSAPQTVTLRVQVTPTQIIVTRTDLGSSNVATLTDSSYRGAYFHYAVVGASVDYHDMVIS